MQGKKNILLTLLFITYPITAHVAIVFTLPSLGVLALTALLLTRVVTADFHLLSKLCCTALIIFLNILAICYHSISPLYLPPIAISTMLLWAFGRTLLPGKEAFITQFMKLMVKKPKIEYLSFTHKLTIVWTIFFFLMLIETILLALFASQETWSLFCNLLNYIFIAAIFVIEWIYRYLKFGHIVSVKQFITTLWQLDLKKLKGHV
ncbi:MAG: hypothetical protein JKY13_03535 [Gammaproteobacteria bacterium]|nr:hypothetical protein [Gammaproteobacteria bacterium]